MEPSEGADSGQVLAKPESIDPVDDVEVSDLKALVNGMLAMLRHSASPERMLEILCDGLRPMPQP